MTVTFKRQHPAPDITGYVPARRKRHQPLASRPSRKPKPRAHATMQHKATYEQLAQEVVTLRQWVAALTHENETLMSKLAEYQERDAIQNKLLRLVPRRKAA